MSEKKTHQPEEAVKKEETPEINVTEQQPEDATQQETIPLENEDIARQENEETPENEDITEDTTQESEGTEEEDLTKQPTATDWHDKYLRLYSEFDNYRKRSNREKIDIIKNASSQVMKDLLPVVDDFDRAIKANESVEDANTLKEGMALIQSKFVGILDKNGLKAMDAIGKTFDVDHHEAITEIPAPSEDLKGKVVDAVEKGYFLNNKVLRYAKVVIGK